MRKFARKTRVRALIQIPDQTREDQIGFHERYDSTLKKVSIVVYDESRERENWEGKVVFVECMTC